MSLRGPTRYAGFPSTYSARKSRTARQQGVGTPFLGAEVDHAAGEPGQLERPALLQVERHRGLHLGSKRIDPADALLGELGLERDAMRAADRDHLAHDVEREGPRQRIGADRPDGRAHRRRDARHRGEEVNFCHSSSTMSAGISALTPPALQASRNACARGVRPCCRIRRRRSAPSRRSS
jgi:hypothetical protein